MKDRRKVLRDKYERMKPDMGVFVIRARASGKVSPRGDRRIALTVGGVREAAPARHAPREFGTTDKAKIDAYIVRGTSCGANRFQTESYFCKPGLMRLFWGI